MTPRLRLARKARLRWDERDGCHYLLYPERGLQLSETAAAIVQLCDGTRTLEALIRELAARHADADGDAARVAADVEAFIDELRQRGLVEEVA